MSVQYEIDYIDTLIQRLKVGWNNDLPNHRWNAIWGEINKLHAKKAMLKLSQYLHHPHYAHLTLDMTQIIVDDLMQDFSEIGLSYQDTQDVTDQYGSPAFVYEIQNGEHQGYHRLTARGIQMLSDLDDHYFEKQYYGPDNEVLR